MRLRRHRGALEAPAGAWPHARGGRRQAPRGWRRQQRLLLRHEALMRAWRWRWMPHRCWRGLQSAAGPRKVAAVVAAVPRRWRGQTHGCCGALELDDLLRLAALRPRFCEKSANPRRRQGASDRAAGGGSVNRCSDTLASIAAFHGLSVAGLHGHSTCARGAHRPTTSSSSSAVAACQPRARRPDGAAAGSQQLGVLARQLGRPRSRDLAQIGRARLHGLQNRSARVASCSPVQSAHRPGVAGCATISAQSPRGCAALHVGLHDDAFSLRGALEQAGRHHPLSTPLLRWARNLRDLCRVPVRRAACVALHNACKTLCCKTQCVAHVRGMHLNGAARLVRTGAQPLAGVVWRLGGITRTPRPGASQACIACGNFPAPVRRSSSSAVFPVLLD